jgi:hypothetical protein
VKFLRVAFEETGTGKLMVATFENNGQEISWAPRWSDIGYLFENAVATEFLNSHGVINDEMDAFHDSAVFVHHLHLTGRERK